MASLTHGSFMEDMSADLRSVLLLGPKPRPPIGGQYHPNARQRQNAEAGARRQRVQRLLEIHESRKALVQMERGLEASRASLLALEEAAGADAVRTLALFKSPAVPTMLSRKRRIRDELGDVAASAVKRHRLEVPDKAADAAASLARRSLYDTLGDGLGVVLRHKRLSALQDDELSRHYDEGLRNVTHRRKRVSAAQDEVVQNDGLRCRRREAAEALRQRSEVVQQDDGRGRHCVTEDDSFRRQCVELAKQHGVKRAHVAAAQEDALQRHRAEAKEKADAAYRYEHVVRELKEAQQDLKIEVTRPSSGSASPPRLRKLILVDEDVSPMELAWLSKPGFEPSTPTDYIPSPLFMRGPRGVPGATPDPLCRSPSAMCRSPCAR